eukprot:221475-Chlamydomonas_euryale.AAC.5
MPTVVAVAVAPSALLQAPVRAKAAVAFRGCHAARSCRSSQQPERCSQYTRMCNVFIALLLGRKSRVAPCFAMSF